MASACLASVFWWSAFLLTDLRLPEFSQDLGIVKISNLTVSKAQMGALNSTINSSLLSIETEAPANINILADVHVISSAVRLVGDVDVHPFHISLTNSVDDACYGVVVLPARCNLNVTFGKMLVDPPNSLLQSLVDSAKDLLGDQLRDMICNTGLPFIAQELQNRTMDPPTPHPTLEPDATPLEHVQLFRSVVTILRSIPHIMGIECDASLHAGTTIHMDLEFPTSFQIALNFDEPPLIWKDIVDGMNALQLGHVLEAFLDFIPTVEGAVMMLDVLPHPSFASFEISLRDLQCSDMLNCTIPRHGGINVGNIRVENFGQWDRFITSDVGPLISPLLDALLQHILESSNATDSRLFIPMIEQAPIRRVPSTVVLVCVVILCVALFAGSVFWSIRHHRQTAVTTHAGVPISLKRVLVEDIVLVVMAIVSIFGFAWSNTTTASILTLGEEIHVMSFSLLKTTKDMFNAGMVLFPMLVFTFSGVYPYVKVIAILVCTLILQRPNLVVLKVVDYFGRFSFLDIYAALIMINGSRIPGVAEVEILPGTYFFLAATILSVIMGNYARAFWRRGTSLRPQKAEKPREPFDSSVGIFSQKIENSVRENKRNFFSRHKFFFLRLLSCAFIVFCTFPSWVFPCLEFSYGGVALIFLPESRRMNMIQLSSSNSVFLATCVLTIGIAPALYCVMYPQWSLLASWCASDAFLLACVGGLFQLGRFVDFSLGGDMESVYSVEAYLLWPLIPLFISSVWQWLLVSEHFFGLTRRLKQCHEARKAKRVAMQP